MIYPFNATELPKLSEVSSVLQHGGVFAREYGKPCVSSIQGITN